MATAKRVVIQVYTMVSPVEGECDVCHFDSLRHIALYQLSVNGVGLLRQVTLCGRCKADERRSRDE